MGFDKKLDEIKQDLDNFEFESKSLISEYIKSVEELTNLYPIRREENKENVELDFWELNSTFKDVFVFSLNNTKNRFTLLKSEISLLGITDSFKDSVESFAKKVHVTSSKFSYLIKDILKLKLKLEKTYKKEFVKKNVFSLIAEPFNKVTRKAAILKKVIQKVYNLTNSLVKLTEAEKASYGKKFSGKETIYGSKVKVEVYPKFDPINDKITKTETIKEHITNFVKDSKVTNNGLVTQLEKAKESSAEKIKEDTAAFLGRLIIRIFKKNPILIRDSNINVKAIINPRLSMDREVEANCLKESTQSNILIEFFFNPKLAKLFIFGPRYFFLFKWGNSFYGSVIHEITHALDNNQDSSTKGYLYAKKMGLSPQNHEGMFIAGFFNKVRSEGLAEIHKNILGGIQHPDLTGSENGPYYLLSLNKLRILYHPEMVAELFDSISNENEFPKKVMLYSKRYQIEYCLGEYLFLIIFLSKMKKKALFFSVPDPRKMRPIIYRETEIQKFAKDNGWAELRKKDLNDYLSLKKGLTERVAVFIDGKYVNNVNEQLVMFNLMDVPKMIKAYIKACKHLGIEQELFKLNDFSFVKDEQIKTFLKKLLG